MVARRHINLNLRHPGYEFSYSNSSITHSALGVFCSEYLKCSLRLFAGRPSQLLIFLVLQARDPFAGINLDCDICILH